MRFELRRAVVAAALASATLANSAAAPAPVAMRTDDVDRFYRAYDAAHGHPTAEQLQSLYLDPGSQALHEFVDARIGNASKLADAVRKRPQSYAQARECLPALAKTSTQLPAVYARLAELYPGAAFPPVTFVIGRDSTGGTTTADGILIGLETMCRQTQMGADAGDRFTHIIAHELAHVQQPASQVDAPPGATLLFQSLVEGGAEFVAELTSGDVSYGHMKTWTRGKECAIEQAFRKDALGTDLSHWLYNGFGTPEKPGDLAYWAGYRISKAYYTQAGDKKQAVFDLLHVDNDSAPGILERSGWQPQTGCRAPHFVPGSPQEG
jgi:hypothetical protein